MLNNQPITVTGIVDIIVIILFVSLGFRGLLRGFIKEIAGFIEIVALIFLLYYKTESFKKLISPILELSYIQALLIFFLVIHITFLLSQTLIESLLNKLKLAFFNRFLGLIFGLLEAFGIIAIIVYIIYSQQIFNPKYILENSKLIDFLMPGINLLFGITNLK